MSDAALVSFDRLVAEHQREIARLNTHSFPLGEIDAAFAAASDKKSGAVKVTVHP